MINNFILPGKHPSKIGSYFYALHYLQKEKNEIDKICNLEHWKTII